MMSENGHLVVLDVSMETMPELAESVNPQFGLAGYAWKVHQQGFMPTGWEWAYPAK